MKKFNIVYVLAIFLSMIAAPGYADQSLANIDDEIKQDVVKINEIMIEKERVEALAVIDRTLAKLEGTSDAAEIDVYQNLNRLKFHLSKYEWDMARRILDDFMAELGLEYQPTFPD